MVDQAQIQPNLALNLDLDTLSWREQESHTWNLQNTIKTCRSNLEILDLQQEKQDLYLFLWFFSLDFDSFCRDFLDKETKKKT